MGDVSLQSSTVSGMLEADFNQIKDVIQDGGVNAIFLDTKSLLLNSVAVTADAGELNLLDGIASISTGAADNDKFITLGYFNDNGAGGATVALDNLASVAINTSLLSDTDNTDALGSISKNWSDLFLGDGGIINWNNGNATITHSAGILTFNVFPVSPSAAPDADYEFSNKKYVDDTAVPGGSDTEILYNNSGAFDGASNVTSDGTDLFIQTHQVNIVASAPGSPTAGDIWIDIS